MRLVRDTSAERCREDCRPSAIGALLSAPLTQDELPSTGLTDGRYIEVSRTTRASELCVLQTLLPAFARQAVECSSILLHFGYATQAQTLNK